MSKWEGFTEEDLQKLKTEEKAPVRKSGSVKIQEAPKPQVAGTTTSMRKQDVETEKSSIETGATKPLSQVAPIQKPPPVALTEKQTGSSPLEPLNSKPLPELTDVSSSKCLTSTPSIIQKKENKLSVAVEPVVRERINLDEYEQRRKAIEEQNRRKKETLAKALNARKQKTAEEAKKLQQIQQELQRLDALLSTEVAILRQHIETASLGLTDAQKRYERAELEFIEAKKELFDKREKKELLTEHLCTIIEQNEVRKANKLSELLRQLDDGDGDEEVIAAQGESSSESVV